MWHGGHWEEGNPVQPSPGLNRAGLAKGKALSRYVLAVCYLLDSNIRGPGRDSILSPIA